MTGELDGPLLVPGWPADAMLLIGSPGVCVLDPPRAVRLGLPASPVPVHA
jgi:hypothetical protein